MSAIHTFTKTFYYLCESPGKILTKERLDNTNISNPIISSEKLFKLIQHVFKAKTFEGNPIINMKDLIKDSYTKDTTWFAFKTYMGPILPDLKLINGRKNGYRDGHPCLNAYIDEISEKHLRAEATKVLDNS